MKKNLSKILFVSILTLSLGACANSAEPGTSTSDVPGHVHQYDEHGVCPADGAYAGVSENASESTTFTFEKVLAQQTYYGRVLGLDKTITYYLDYTFTQYDGGVVIKTWGSDDDSNFTEINLLNPSSALNFSKVYLSFTPTKSEYDITFDIVDASVDEIGYHSNGQYTGIELIRDDLIKNYSLKKGTSYFRVEASKDDLYCFVCGKDIFTSKYYFYTRTTDGVIKRINETVGIPFVMPDAPDGYLYVVTKNIVKETVPLFGLADMNSDLGHNDGIFLGKMLEVGLLSIPDLRADQRYFYKLVPYANHKYSLFSFSEYTEDEIFWYGSNGDKYNGFKEISIDAEGKYNGVVYEYFVVMFEPANDHYSEYFRYSITHDEAMIDDVHVCKADNIYDGEEVECEINYWLDEHEKAYYRVPITSGKQYKLVYSMWYGFYTVSFYVCSRDHTYESISWDVIETPQNKETKPQTLNSEDGYLYFNFDGKEDGDVIYIRVFEVE